MKFLLISCYFWASELFLTLSYYQKNVSMSIFTQDFFGEHMHAFPFHIYLGVDFIGHWVKYVSLIRKCHKIFQNDSSILHSP